MIIEEEMIHHNGESAITKPQEKKENKQHSQGLERLEKQSPSV